LSEETLRKAKDIGKSVEDILRWLPKTGLQFRQMSLIKVCPLRKRALAHASHLSGEKEHLAVKL
jgi:hypothetical protein